MVAHHIGQVGGRWPAHVAARQNSVLMVAHHIGQVGGSWPAHVAARQTMVTRPISRGLVGGAGGSFGLEVSGGQRKFPGGQNCSKVLLGSRLNWQAEALRARFSL